jgi:hypothetical protein
MVVQFADWAYAHRRLHSIPLHHGARPSHLRLHGVHPRSAIQESLWGNLAGHHLRAQAAIPSNFSGRLPAAAPLVPAMANPRRRLLVPIHRLAAPPAHLGPVAPHRAPAPIALPMILLACAAGHVLVAPGPSPLHHPRICARTETRAAPKESAAPPCGTGTPPAAPAPPRRRRGKRIAACRLGGADGAPMAVGTRTLCRAGASIHVHCPS